MKITETFVADILKADETSIEFDKESKILYVYCSHMYYQMAAR